jgi:hypothetical protein
MKEAAGRKGQAEESCTTTLKSGLKPKAEEAAAAAAVDVVEEKCSLLLLLLLLLLPLSWPTLE